MTRRAFRIEHLLVCNSIPATFVWADKIPYKRPLLILCHAVTTQRKSLLVTALDLAEQGYFVVTWDAVEHGDRAKKNKQKELVTAKWLAWELGHAVHDVQALLENACRRKEVNANRIGILGFSMGGMNALAAMKRDSRIQVGGILISTGDYAGFQRAAPERNRLLGPSEYSHALEKLTRLSVHSDPAGFGVRPMFFGAGANDMAVPPEFARSTYKCLLPYYKKANRQAELICKVYPNIGHNVTPPMRRNAESFLRQHLRPEPTNSR